MKTFLFLILISFSVGARADLNPTPTLECSYPNGGYAHFTLKLQVPLIIEGRSFTQFEFEDQNVRFCINPSDLDLDLMKHYKYSLSDYSTVYFDVIKGSRQCVQNQKHVLYVRLPVRKFRNYTWELTAYIVLKETVSPVPESNCEVDDR